MEELLKEILDQIKALNQNLTIQNHGVLSADEACKYLDISYPHFLRLKKEGKIPCAQVGRRILCRVESLNNWLKRLEEESVIQEDDYFSKLRKELNKSH